MASGYRARGGAVHDALASVGIGTAKALAEKTGMAQGTAQRVFRGDPVMYGTASVVAKLVAEDGSPQSSKAMELFEYVRDAKAATP